MNEWTIVTTIVVIVGLIVTVTTPLLKLNTSITQLRSLIENVVKRVDDNEHDNTESHRRIWKHNDEQDALLQNHALRIHDLEKGTNHEH
jgi:hypothetical protein